MNSANAFESAANSLQTGVRRIKNIAEAIRDQFYRSDQITRSLTDFWQGKSADAFITAWISCYQNAQKSVSHLDVGSSCCAQLAQTLEENLSALRNWESMQLLQSQMQIHGSNTGSEEFQQVFQQAFQQAMNAQAAITMMVSSLSSQLENEADQIEVCPQEKSVSPFDPWNSGTLYYNDGELSLVSPETVEEQIQVEENAIEAKVVEDELLLLEEEGKDDPNALYAKSNKRVFQNPINRSMESTDENMPPGVKNAIGKKLIDMIKKLGIRVEWNRSMQVELANSGTNGAYGATINLNGTDPVNADKNFVIVGLSPDATNAVVYEEYLHAQNAAARGWANLSPGAEPRLAEEIQVEYNVLQNAQDLNMSSVEFDELNAGRRSYIEQLKDLYQKSGRAWPPENLNSYLQDPPKPLGLR